MKRGNIFFISIIILAVSMIFLCSCNINEDEKKTVDNVKNNDYIDDQDYQFQYAAKDYFSSGNKINETDEGYYFVDDGFIYFMDKSSMEYTPLCNKPDCRHDKNSNCNAYMNSLGVDIESNIFYNNGYIYYPAASSKGGKTIMRLSADGAVKEKVTDIKSEWIPIIIVHRGYLYYFESTYGNNDTDGLNSGDMITANSQIKRIDLGDSSFKSEVLLDNDTLGKGKINTVQSIKSAYGNHILIYYQSFKQKISDNGRGGLMRQDTDYEEKNILVNTDTGKVTDITFVKDKNDERIKDVCYLKGKLLFDSAKRISDDAFDYSCVYTMDFDGTGLKKVFTKPEGFENAYLYSDEKNIYLCTVLPDSPNILSFMIYDTDFNLVNTAEVDCKAYEYDADCVLVGIGDKMFFRSVSIVDEDNDGQYEKEVHLVRYVNKSEMLTSKTRLSITTAYEKNIEV